MVARKRSSEPVSSQRLPKAEADASDAPSSASAPVAKHLQTGRLGEEAAAAYLAAKGFQIIARNWRYKQLELDIIARDGTTIVFAEVKTRDMQGIASPYEALTRSKQQKLIKAASQWLTRHQMWNEPCRFDLVCVSTDTDSEHWLTTTIQDAHTAGTLQGKADAKTLHRQRPLLTSIKQFFAGKSCSPVTDDQSARQVQQLSKALQAGPDKLQQPYEPASDTKRPNAELTCAAQCKAVTVPKQHSPDALTQLFSVEHISDAFELSQPLGGGDTAWQPW